MMEIYILGSFTAHGFRSRDWLNLKLLNISDCRRTLYGYVIAKGNKIAGIKAEED